MNYDIYVVRHVDENFKCCAQNNSSSMIYLLLENGTIVLHYCKEREPQEEGIFGRYSAGVQIRAQSRAE